MIVQSPEPARILIANGVNLDLLGKREPEIYGVEGLAFIEDRLQEFSPKLADICGISHPSLYFFQTNKEDEFLEKISEAWSGALINAGAWTHTSLALADRLKGLDLSFVEVHLSNLARREDFRQRSFSASHALGICSGFGVDSYLSALTGLYFWIARSSNYTK